MWTVLSQTPRETPQVHFFVTYDAGLILALIFIVPQRTQNAEKQDNQGILSFHFLKGKWQVLPLTGRKKIQALS